MSQHHRAKRVPRKSMPGEFQSSAASTGRHRPSPGAADDAAPAQTETETERETERDASSAASGRRQVTSVTSSSSSARAQRREPIYDREQTWTQGYSSQRNKSYWHNPWTGITVWTRPEGRIIEGKSTSSSATGEKSTVADTSPRHSTNKWIETYSQQYGRPCWVNYATGVRVWRRPEGEHNVVSSRIDKDEGISLTTTEKDKWISGYSHLYQRTFWYNIHTGIRVWSCPYVETPENEKDSDSRDTFVVEESLETRTVPTLTSTAATCQAGIWVQEYSSLHGKLYWRDVVTGKCTWDKPAGEVWMKRFSVECQSYYWINSITGEGRLYDPYTDCSAICTSTNSKELTQKKLNAAEPVTLSTPAQAEKSMQTGKEINSDVDECLPFVTKPSAGLGSAVPAVFEISSEYWIEKFGPHGNSHWINSKTRRSVCVKPTGRIVKEGVETAGAATSTTPAQKTMEIVSTDGKNTWTWRYCDHYREYLWFNNATGSSRYSRPDGTVVTKAEESIVTPEKSTHSSILTDTSDGPSRPGRTGSSTSAPVTSTCYPGDVAYKGVCTSGHSISALTRDKTQTATEMPRTPTSPYNDEDIWVEKYSTATGYAYWTKVGTNEYVSKRPSGIVIQEGDMDTDTRKDQTQRSTSSETAPETPIGAYKESCKLSCDDIPRGSVAVEPTNIWVEKYSHQYCRPYWVNHSTGNKTWNRPKDTITDHEESTAVASYDNIQSDTSSSKVLSTKGASVAAGVECEWVEAYSSEYCQKYWYSKKTRKTTWCQPTDMDGPGDSAKETQEANLLESTFTPSKSNGKWIQKYSESQKRYFWDNVRSGARVWRLPEGEIITDSGGESSSAGLLQASLPVKAQAESSLNKAPAKPLAKTATMDAVANPIHSVATPEMKATEAIEDHSRPCQTALSTAEANTEGDDACEQALWDLLHDDRVRLAELVPLLQQHGITTLEKAFIALSGSDGGTIRCSLKLLQRKRFDVLLQLLGEGKQATATKSCGESTANPSFAKAQEECKEVMEHMQSVQEAIGNLNILLACGIEDELMYSRSVPESVISSLKRTKQEKMDKLSELTDQLRTFPDSVRNSAVVGKKTDTMTTKSKKRKCSVKFDEKLYVVVEFERYLTKESAVIDQDAELAIQLAKEEKLAFDRKREGERFEMLTSEGSGTNKSSFSWDCNMCGKTNEFSSFSCADCSRSRSSYFGPAPSSHTIYYPHSTGACNGVRDCHFHCSSGVSVSPPQKKQQSQQQTLTQPSPPQISGAASTPRNISPVKARPTFRNRGRYSESLGQLQSDTHETSNTSQRQDRDDNYRRERRHFNAERSKFSRHGAAACYSDSDDDSDSDSGDDPNSEDEVDYVCGQEMYEVSVGVVKGVADAVGWTEVGRGDALARQQKTNADARDSARSQEPMKRKQQNPKKRRSTYDRGRWHKY